MLSKDEHNKNMEFSLKIKEQKVIRKLNPGMLSFKAALFSLVVCMFIPMAFAQNNSATSDNLTNTTLENIDMGTENVQSNSSTSDTAASSSASPQIINRNLSLQSFSSFVNDINSKLREESSDSNSVSNAFTTNSSIPSSNSTYSFSSSASTQSLKQNASPSKLLNLKEVIIQNTSMSVPAPVRHPGQPTHEVVFALPLRTDGHIWTGTVTFTASKPIEVEVLHTYGPLEKPDDLHGQPYYAVLPGNKSIAITHLRNLVDVPIEINGTGISSGTLDFAGNALVFHKTTGEPFTVTYTIDAVSKKLTQFAK